MGDNRRESTSNGVVAILFGSIAGIYQYMANIHLNITLLAKLFEVALTGAVGGACGVVGKELVMLIMPSLVGVTGYGILKYYLNIYEKAKHP